MDVGKYQLILGSIRHKIENLTIFFEQKWKLKILLDTFLNLFLSLGDHIETNLKV